MNGYGTFPMFFRNKTVDSNGYGAFLMCLFTKNNNDVTFPLLFIIKCMAAVFSYFSHNKTNGYGVFLMLLVKHMITVLFLCFSYQN